jgi:hypothetical protein
MHRTDLLSVLHASPFRPFKLIMIDGNEYPVPHEDFAHVIKTGTIIYADTGDRPWKMLNADLVARIEFLEEEARGN